MKIKKIISFNIILILLVFVLNCAYYNTMFNAKKEYNEGIKIIQSEPEKTTHPNADRHFNSTIDKCWKLIEIYSDKSKYADDALMYIVRSEYYVGKYPQAKLHLEQFRKKYPKSEFIPEAFLWEGKLLIQEDKLDDARSALNRCLTESENSEVRAQAYYELGNLAFQNENYTAAIEVFQKALSEKLDKQYAASIQYYLGESYFAQEQYENAIPRFREVEKYAPSLDIEYKTKFNLAQSYAYIKKYNAALEILRKMLTAPRFSNFIPSIKTEIAHINDQQGRTDLALDLYKEVVKERKSAPGTALASLNLADIYENRLDNIDSAVFYYGKVKKLYSRFDSIDYAERKFKFLSGLKDIRDAIKIDSRLIYRLENDRYFRDSLYNAQLEDSIQKELEKLEKSNLDSTKQKNLDSLKQVLNAMNNDIFGNDTTNIDGKEENPDSTESQNQNEFPDDDNPLNQLQSENPKNQSNTNETVQKPEKKLEQRKLPQIKKDLKNNTYHLAEFFLLEVGNYDSALVHYNNFLNLYSDSILTPKALYSIYYIKSDPEYSDSATADSVQQILINDYPNSPFTYKLMELNGIPIDTVHEDTVEQKADSLFRVAEKLKYSNQIDSAIKIYRKVANIDTSRLISAKAQYNIAWLYERTLENMDSAMSAYTKLNTKYPFKDYQKIALNKISPPKAEPLKSDSLDSTKVYPDSSVILASGENIGENTIAPDDDSNDSKGFPIITNRKRYRTWRQNRIQK